MINAELLLSDFDYYLPPELIAQKPAAQRNQSRLLRVSADNSLHDHVFTDLPQFLRPHDLLVFNNTKVIKARLYGAKGSGGKIEGLVERIITPTKALMHIKSSKSPKAGTVLFFAPKDTSTDNNTSQLPPCQPTCTQEVQTASEALHPPLLSSETLVFTQPIKATVLGRQDDLFEVEFAQEVLTVLDQIGSLPLPPYIEHQADAEDSERYQTVYADHLGAVAAPTAGLHFDQAMLETLKQQGVATAFVTLHVGAGTFQPVRVDKISDHVMHSEWYEVSADTVQSIKHCREQGGRVFAVGTTSVRALESAANHGVHNRVPVAHSGDTRLFMTPGYEIKVVDGLLTNFHLPQSTLLMLVSSFIGIDAMRDAYAHAIKQRYRFFSYGDAMLIEPRER
ncbi:tRNA preQ1(34) S-adenosylmethionine ribosyltransferase-isomerase QueA [Pelistega europaea]|uniref:S-adenosylmethionine:tRNA ribosyltransferase-isomerase n=1 Tax=Pelistega europaea TaxID=106147 RepID=A0A7Y4P3T7_9BURK|nr:tRNA preQ1(34) S-adenosylmethionine ribosyltransferase-isomerase QueA [Pelistega europaea]NOL48796.1 tRNA preQ1(34) S-adenosylmethionine ribosyltransferase-isomerase QueA [Pelistega europaea]